MASRSETQTKGVGCAVRPSLDGVLARIERAHDHLDQLNLVLAKHERTDPSKGTFTQHETDEQSVVVHIKSQPEVPMLARLLIGETVHSLAVGLDNLAFQLCLSHQTSINTPDAFTVCDKAKTYFPIFATSTAEDLNTIDKRLRLMAPAPAQIIRDMQPYQRPEPTRDPLWILRQLDVVDKHRVVLAVAHAGAVRELTINTPDEGVQVIETKDSPWQSLVEGAELLTLRLTPNPPKSSSDLKIKMARRILFDKTSICDGDNVLWLLKELIPFVRRNVVAPLAHFVT
jgi:hypothetical protein